MRLLCLSNKETNQEKMAKSFCSTKVAIAVFEHCKGDMCFNDEDQIQCIRGHFDELSDKPVVQVDHERVTTTYEEVAAPIDWTMVGEPNDPIGFCFNGNNISSLIHCYQWNKSGGLDDLPLITMRVLPPECREAYVEHCVDMVTFPKKIHFSNGTIQS